MKKIVLKGEELRQAIVDAVNELAEPVASTLGPKGQNVLLTQNVLLPSKYLANCNCSRLPGSCGANHR